MTVTEHAKKRIKERTGVNSKGCDQSAEKALSVGLKHAELNGSLRRYVDGLYLKQRSANNIRIYAHHVYLFSGDTLITVIPLPNKYNVTADKLKAKREIL